MTDRFKGTYSKREQKYPEYTRNGDLTMETVWWW